MSAENSEESQSGTADRGQILLIALVALALIASVIMLITDSNSALKLALLAALWAAIIGFFLVFRYRRQAEQSHEQLEHERQLHEAHTAKAEAERAAEKERMGREQQEAERAGESETLVKIQEELAELRANLEALSGRDLGYEPAALRAQARRIMELEAETGGESQGPHIKGAPSTAAVTGLLGQTPKEPMRRVPENPAEEPAAAAESAVDQSRGTAVPVAAEADDTSATRTFDTGSFTSVKWDEVGDRHVADATPAAAAASTEPAEKPAESAESAAATESEQDPAAAPTAEELAEQRRGRRRRDERSDSLSVADLLANITKDRE